MYSVHACRIAEFDAVTGFVSIMFFLHNHAFDINLAHCQYFFWQSCGPPSLASSWLSFWTICICLRYAIHSLPLFYFLLLFCSLYSYGFSSVWTGHLSIGVLGSRALSFNDRGNSIFVVMLVASFRFLHLVCDIFCRVHSFGCSWPFQEVICLAMLLPLDSAGPCRSHGCSWPSARSCLPRDVVAPGLRWLLFGFRLLLAFYKKYLCLAMLLPLDSAGSTFVVLGCSWPFARSD